MIIYGVPMADLIRLADSTDARVDSVKVQGKGIRFILRPTGERYRKVNPISKRRTAVFCWHGHFEYLRELFHAYPAAKVKTDMVTYDGATDFHAKAWDTGTVRLNTHPQSPWYPFTVADCCHCEE
jgi:hypothetical protein